MAKLNRERELREKRERKQEKKQAKKLAAAIEEEGGQRDAQADDRSGGVDAAPGGEPDLA